VSSSALFAPPVLVLGENQLFTNHAEPESRGSCLILSYVCLVLHLPRRLLSMEAHRKSQVVQGLTEDAKTDEIGKAARRRVGPDCLCGSLGLIYVDRRATVYTMTGNLRKHNDSSRLDAKYGRKHRRSRRKSNVSTPCLFVLILDIGIAIPSTRETIL
jgi:hypothetical protein